MLNCSSSGTSGSPVIYKISGAEVEACDDFAAIGTGAILAEAALFHRAEPKHTDLQSVIYRVYEAKRLGEKALGVGPETLLMISRRESGTMMVQVVRAAGLKELEKMYKRFGPRPLKITRPIDVDRDEYVSAP